MLVYIAGNDINFLLFLESLLKAVSMPTYRPLKQYDYTGFIILANNSAQTKYMLFDRTLYDVKVYYCIFSERYQACSITAAATATATG